MQETLFEKVISNFDYAIICFLIATMAFHLLLVYPKNLSKRGWKQVDYLWISLTAIGLIGPTTTVKSRVTRNQMEAINVRVPVAYRSPKYFLSPAYHSYVCRDNVRTELSPDNFDEIVEDDRRSCL